MEQIEAYDIADDLESQEDVLAYLSEVMDGPGNPELLLAAVGEVARSKGFTQGPCSPPEAAAGF